MENNQILANKISEFRGFLKIYRKFSWILYLLLAVICVIIVANIDFVKIYGQSVSFKDLFNSLKEDAGYEKSLINSVKVFRMIYVIAWGVVIEGFAVAVVNLVFYIEGKKSPLTYTISYGVQLFVASLIVFIFQETLAKDFELSRYSCGIEWMILLFFAVIYVVLPIIYRVFDKLVVKLEKYNDLQTTSSLQKVKSSQQAYPAQQQAYQQPVQQQPYQQQPYQQRPYQQQPYQQQPYQQQQYQQQQYQQQPYQQQPIQQQQYQQQPYQQQPYQQQQYQQQPYQQQQYQQQPYQQQQYQQQPYQQQQYQQQPYQQQQYQQQEPVQQQQKTRQPQERNTSVASSTDNILPEEQQTENLNLGTKTETNDSAQSTPYSINEEDNMTIVELRAPGYCYVTAIFFADTAKVIKGQRIMSINCISFKTMIEAPCDGILILNAKVGDNFKSGDILAYIDYGRVE